MYEMLRIGQDTGCQGTTELRGSPSRAGKVEGLGHLCASLCHKTLMQGHILPCVHYHLLAGTSLAAGTSTSKVLEELPKKCLNRAAAPLGCRQHVLQESWCSAYPSPRCHPYLPPSKAQEQSLDMPLSQTSPVPGISGTPSITRGLKATPGHNSLLLSLCSAPLVIPITSSHHSSHLRPGCLRGCSPFILQHLQRQPEGRWDGGKPTPNCTHAVCWQPLSEPGLSVAQPRDAAEGDKTEAPCSSLHSHHHQAQPTGHTALTPACFGSSCLTTSNPVLSTHLPIQAAQQPQQPLPSPTLAQFHRVGKGDRGSSLFYPHSPHSCQFPWQQGKLSTVRCRIPHPSFFAPSSHSSPQPQSPAALHYLTKSSPLHPNTTRLQHPS